MLSSAKIIATIAVGAVGCSAFVPAAVPSTAVRAPALRMAAKINESVELDSPKVVNNEKLAPGDKCVYCRCWKSATFPKCDGAHVKHNEATGDNVGPLIVAVDK